MPAKAHTALRVAGATLLCSVLAVLVSLPFQHQDLDVRSKVPLLFLLVIVLVTRKMGEAAGIMGTISAAIVFAALLFPFLTSFNMATRPARASLAWFLLGGMVCAHLLSPHSGRARRSDSDFSQDGRDTE